MRMLGGGAALNIHCMMMTQVVVTIKCIAVFIGMLPWVGIIIQGERNAKALVPRHRKGTED